jgi:hypothetical protein
LGKAANETLQNLDTRSLSNLAYAFALLGRDPTIHNKMTLLGNMAFTSIECIHQFNSHDISNMVWAYATLKSTPILFPPAADVIVSLSDLNEFKPQALSNILWSYATLNVVHSKLFQKIGDSIVEKSDLSDFKPQELSNIVWACATAKFHHPELLTNIGDAIVELNDLKSFQPQSLSNIVWAYATADVQHSSLFQKVGDYIAEKADLKSFTHQAIANVLCAYVKDLQHRKLFRVVGDYIVASDASTYFNTQALSNTVWAYAAANELRDDLFTKIAAVIVERGNVRSFNMQDIATTAWAYAVADVDVQSLFNEDFEQTILHKSNKAKGEDLAQLYQWHLWQAGEKSNYGLPTSLQSTCREAFLRDATTSSALQRDVVSELKYIGLDPIEEYLTPSGYRVDALVEINDTKIGVEVDGPFHFIGRTVNGSTKLKQRQVRALDNIRIISVPYWEWNELGNDRSKKQLYLQSLCTNLCVV